MNTLTECIYSNFNFIVDTLPIIQELQKKQSKSAIINYIRLQAPNSRKKDRKAIRLVIKELNNAKN